MIAKFCELILKQHGQCGGILTNSIIDAHSAQRSLCPSSLNYHTDQDSSTCCSQPEESKRRVISLPFPSIISYLLQSSFGQLCIVDKTGNSKEVFRPVWQKGKSVKQPNSKLLWPQDVGGSHILRIVLFIHIDTFLFLFGEKYHTCQNEWASGRISIFPLAVDQSRLSASCIVSYWRLNGPSISPPLPVVLRHNRYGRATPRLDACLGLVIKNTSRHRRSWSLHV